MVCGGGNHNVNAHCPLLSYLPTRAFIFVVYRRCDLIMEPDELDSINLALSRSSSFIKLFPASGLQVTGGAQEAGKSNSGTAKPGTSWTACVSSNNGAYTLRQVVHISRRCWDCYLTPHDIPITPRRCKLAITYLD